MEKNKTAAKSRKDVEIWQAEHLERIVIKPNKKEHLYDRVQMAVDNGLARSRQAYILAAIRKALEEDGIPPIEE